MGEAHGLSIGEVGRPAACCHGAVGPVDGDPLVSPVGGPGRLIVGPGLLCGLGEGLTHRAAHAGCRGDPCVVDDREANGVMFHHVKILRGLRGKLTAYRFTNLKSGFEPTGN